MSIDDFVKEMAKLTVRKGDVTFPLNPRNLVHIGPMFGFDAVECPCTCGKDDCDLKGSAPEHAWDGVEWRRRMDAVMDAAVAAEAGE